MEADVNRNRQAIRSIDYDDPAPWASRLSWLALLLIGVPISGGVLLAVLWLVASAGARLIGRAGL